MGFFGRLDVGGGRCTFDSLSNAVVVEEEEEEEQAKAEDVGETRRGGSGCSKGIMSQHRNQ